MPDAEELIRPYPGLSCWHHARQGTVRVPHLHRMIAIPDGAESTHGCPWLSHWRRVRRGTVRDPESSSMTPGAVDSTRPCAVVSVPCSTRNREKPTFPQ